MNAKTDIAVLKALIAVCAVLALSMFAGSLRCDPAAMESNARAALDVHDVELLSDEQKAEAVDNDAVAFEACGMGYVVEEGAREGLEDYLK